MDSTKAYAFVLLGVFLLLFVNALMTKEIFTWVPLVRKQVAFLLLVWLLPVFGLLIVNRWGKMGWFAKKASQSGPAAVTQGFMEADAVFNPGMKHRIELVEKQKSELVEKTGGTSEAETGGRRKPE